MRWFDHGLVIVLALLMFHHGSDARRGAGPGDSACGVVASYGTSSPGSGGFLPVFTLDGCARPGGDVTLALQGGLGGALTFVFVGHERVDYQLPNGCHLHIWPFLRESFAVVLLGSGPGQGWFSYAGPIPVEGAGTTHTLQAFLIDPGATGGFTSSNAVELTVSGS